MALWALSSPDLQRGKTEHSGGAMEKPWRCPSEEHFRCFLPPLLHPLKNAHKTRKIIPQIHKIIRRVSKNEGNLRKMHRALCLISAL